MTVERSGDLYRVATAAAAMLVNPATGRKSAVLPPGGIDRLAAVDAPWEPVAEADWPEPVRAAAEVVRDAPDPTEALR